jgi:hypothetical protein
VEQRVHASADARDELLGSDPEPVREPRDCPEARLPDGSLEPRDLRGVQPGPLGELLLRQPGRRAVPPEVCRELLLRSHGGILGELGQ